MQVQYMIGHCAVEPQYDSVEWYAQCERHSAPSPSEIWQNHKQHNSSDSVGASATLGFVVLYICLQRFSFVRFASPYVHALPFSPSQSEDSSSSSHLIACHELCGIALHTQFPVLDEPGDSAFDTLCTLLSENVVAVALVQIPYELPYSVRDERVSCLYSLPHSVSDVYVYALYWLDNIVSPARLSDPCESHNSVSNKPYASRLSRLYETDNTAFDKSYISGKVHPCDFCLWGKIQGLQGMTAHILYIASSKPEGTHPYLNCLSFSTLLLFVARVQGYTRSAWEATPSLGNTLIIHSFSPSVKRKGDD